MTRYLNRSVLGAVAGALLFGGGCALQPQVPEKSPLVPATGTVAVKLIAFNDFHGNLKTPNLRVPVPDAAQSTGFRLERAGGVEQFSAVVRELRAKNRNHVVVSAGDMVGATPLLSAFFKDEPTIEAMNLVGVDIHAVGNHEFDYGFKHLKRLQAGGCAPNKDGVPDCGGRPPYAGAKFAFLAANVMDTAAGQTLFPAYVVKDFEGVKVAFIGMTLKDTPAIVRPGGTAGLVFKDEIETVNQLVPEIKAKGVEAIVVVIHEGGIQAASGGINDCRDFSGRGRELAEKFNPAVDVIVSAHTHRFYICEVAGKLMTSAGSYGTLITEIDLTIDRASGKIVGKKAQNRIVDPNGAKDPALTALVDQYAKLAEPLENRVVAKVTREVTSVPNASGESILGNLIADAHLQSAAAPDKGGAVIAFNNPGSLRAPIIPAADGSVKYGDLFKTQPFQNDLISMNLTGRQLKALLEQQFGEDRPRVMGVSAGFTYTWDMARPRGDKVVPGTMKLGGVAISPDLQYRVVANSFVAGGSEGLTVFRDGTERQVGVLDLEALVGFLGANSPYTPPGVGRITRLN
ncbi:MAG: bifunctional metallophosphatase/5'-nucleotidase [Betaproteobacteria bacterium]|nr:bifunctional metallophosphatase/5'-nucleotidase [Betaproteobacteria bacterium]